MFAHWRENQFRLPTRFFLTFSLLSSPTYDNAPPDLLQQLRQEGFDVEPGSRFRIGRGVECSVGQIDRLSKSKVQVYGGYLFGKVGGEWGYFQLVKKRGQWRVVSWAPKEFA